ncbi:MAG: hypothetical protein JWL70_2978 [Acidimicrobiia bacterium]|nr:hypothetical protein [Acidimicrobiia bacterium]
MSEIELLATGFQTVEGPTIAPDGSLYFSDVRGGGVHRLMPDGTVEVVIPKRKGVGGLCLHADGGLVVAGRDVSHVVDGTTRVLFTRDDAPAADGLTIGGFNDLGADPAGRIFAGAQRFTADGNYGPGLLIMVTGERSGEVLYEGLLPNGNCVSPDEAVLYQMHSTGPLVLLFALTANPPELIGQFSTDALPGRPDGACVDENGDLWIAFHHGGCVGRFTPEGQLRDRIEFPTPTVTSLCFGKPGSHDLYVVTDDETDSADPQGCIYRLDVGVGGAPVHPARV